MRELIRLENIYKSYRTKNGSVPVLENISLTINEGEFVAITGKSGSGKSSLMNIIGCLDKADSGNYIFDGVLINSLPEKEITKIRSRRIGFVFQNFNLIPSMNAVENVSLPLMYRGIKRKERESAAAEALDMVGLTHRMYHRPGEMSGGQQQRTAIARAVAASPSLLLCDEPTGSLDQASGEDVLSVIRKMNDNGVTVVMITHDREIASNAKRCISVADGRIVRQEYLIK